MSLSSYLVDHLHGLEKQWAVAVTSLPERDLVEQRCNEFLERTAEDLKKVEQAPKEHSCNAADMWVINYGRAVLEVAEQHLRTHMHELITMARAEPRKDAAE